MHSVTDIPDWWEYFISTRSSFSFTFIQGILWVRLPYSPAAGPVTQDQISRMLAVSPITLADKVGRTPRADFYVEIVPRGKIIVFFYWIIRTMLQKLPQNNLEGT